MCTSLFSLTILAADDPNPRLSVARIALSMARSSAWETSAQRVIDLPSSLPCYLVGGTITGPDGEQSLFQARVATTHPAGFHLLVLDLTSPALEHQEAYTDILEAIAHTLTFTDPDPSPATAAPRSRVLDLLR